jgi:MEMO1 family protein
MEKPEFRTPIAEGHFYPASPAELSAELAQYLGRPVSVVEALACVLPHAGYMYSGPVAGATVARLASRDTVFLLGPNHTGYGTPFSVMSHGAWKTPLGSVPLNRGLARKLIASAEIFNDDELAHLREHSLEVELPFLQKTFKPFSIVPVSIASDNDALLREAGTQIGLLIKREKLAGRALICASSDFTHYEPQEAAQKKDRMAIDAILELDAAKLLRVVRQKNISMCGYMPVAAMLAACQVLGATHAELVKYQTSGDVTGDLSSVVGYAGIIIS